MSSLFDNISPKHWPADMMSTIILYDKGRMVAQNTPVVGIVKRDMNNVVEYVQIVEVIPGTLNSYITHDPITHSKIEVAETEVFVQIDEFTNGKRSYKANYKLSWFGITKERLEDIERDLAYERAMNLL